MVCHDITLKLQRTHGIAHSQLHHWALKLLSGSSQPQNPFLVTQERLWFN